jgi:hypothetical protein
LREDGNRKTYSDHSGVQVFVLFLVYKLEADTKKLTFPHAYMQFGRNHGGSLMFRYSRCHAQLEGFLGLVIPTIIYYYSFLSLNTNLVFQQK